MTSIASGGVTPVCARPGCNDPLRHGKEYCSNSCAAQDRKRKNRVDGIMSGMNYALEYLPPDAVRGLVNMVGQDAIAPLEEIALAVSQKQPIAAPPLLRRWTESGLPDYRYGVLRYQNRSYRRSDALSYDTIDDMRKNGSVEFALAMKQSPIRAVLRNERSWKVKCEDERMRKIVEGIMQYVFKRRAKDFLDHMPFGAMFFEKVFDRRSGVEWGIEGVRGQFYGYDDLKPIHPKSIKYIRYKPDGHTFNGFVQQKQVGGEVPIKQALALILTYDKEFRNLWGNPCTAKMYPFWFWLELCWRAFLRYLQRTGDPVTIVEAPQRGTIIGPDDIEYGTMEYALMIAGYIMNSSAAALPSDTDEHGNKLWEVRFLQDQARGDQFIRAIERLATNLTRAVVVGDMVGQQADEGRGGYNQSMQHWEVTQLHNEEVALELMGQCDRYLVAPVVHYNGSARTPPATLETETLSPQQRNRLFELFKIIGNQQNSEAFRTVDWRTIMEENEVPALTQDEIDKEFERELARQEKRQESAGKIQQKFQQQGQPAGQKSGQKPGQPKSNPQPPGRSKVRQSQEWAAYQLTEGALVPVLLTADQAIDMLDRTVQDRPKVFDMGGEVILNDFEAWLEEWVLEMDDDELDLFMMLDAEGAAALLHDFMEVIRLQGPDRAARRAERRRKRKEWWGKVKSKIKEVAGKIWDKAKEVGGQVIDKLGRVWNPADHPRDAMGRFVAKGEPVEESEEIHEDGSRTVRRKYVTPEGEPYWETTRYDAKGRKKSTSTSWVATEEDIKRAEEVKKQREEERAGRALGTSKAWKAVGQAMRALGIEISDEALPENTNPIEFIMTQRPGQIIRDLRDGKGVAVNFTDDFIAGVVEDLYRDTNFSNFGIQLKDEAFVIGSTVNFDGNTANVFLDGKVHAENNQVTIELTNAKVGRLKMPQLLVRGLVYLVEKDYQDNEFLSNVDIGYEIRSGKITITGHSQAVKALSIEQGNMVVGLDPLYILGKMAQAAEGLESDEETVALSADSEADRIIREVMAEANAESLSAEEREQLIDYILGLLGLRRAEAALSGDLVVIELGIGDFLRKAMRKVRIAIDRVVKRVTGKDLADWKGTRAASPGRGKYAPSTGTAITKDGRVWREQDHPRDPQGRFAEKGDGTGASGQMRPGETPGEKRRPRGSRGPSQTPEQKEEEIQRKTDDAMSRINFYGEIAEKDMPAYRAAVEAVVRDPYLSSYDVNWEQVHVGELGDLDDKFREVAESVYGRSWGYGGACYFPQSDDVFADMPFDRPEYWGDEYRHSSFMEALVHEVGHSTRDASRRGNVGEATEVNRYWEEGLNTLVSYRANGDDIVRHEPHPWSYNYARNTVIKLAAAVHGMDRDAIWEEVETMHSRARGKGSRDAMHIINQAFSSLSQDQKRELERLARMPVYPSDRGDGLSNLVNLAAEMHYKNVAPQNWEGAYEKWTVGTVHRDDFGIFVKSLPGEIDEWLFEPQWQDAVRKQSEERVRRFEADVEQGPEDQYFHRMRMAEDALWEAFLESEGHVERRDRTPEDGETAERSGTDAD